jgi:bifunctional pyridoxal-dependent enzyme with beta-cystathionase and maltose regulon repressor activities
MDVQGIWGIVVLGLIIGVIIRVRRKTRTGRTFDVGPGAYGSVYDLLNQDKRKAIEIILEEKAEARDPEDADGNLPELEHPRR